MQLLPRVYVGNTVTHLPQLNGCLHEATLVSEALRSNPLGDPHERAIWVYTPPDYADDSRRYPSIYMLQGLTDELRMWLNRSALRPTFIELVDSQFGCEQLPPCVLVFVDAWTSLGGSQFLDSPGTGRYHTYLCEELVPFVDSRFRTLTTGDSRGIAGHSSGGYGAIVTALLRPDLFGAVATHAGDALFEAAYQPMFPRALRALHQGYAGSYERFWVDFRSRPAFSRPGDTELMCVWAMSACYSAEADGTVTLPFEVASGRVIPGVWERWLAWDPVRLIPERPCAARSLRGVFIDSGTRDEWFSDLGAAAVHQELLRLEVANLAFELFDGAHAGNEFRLPRGVEYLLGLLVRSS
jgi:hypothetical protein